MNVFLRQPFPNGSGLVDGVVGEEVVDAVLRPHAEVGDRRLDDNLRY